MRYSDGQKMSALRVNKAEGMSGSYYQDFLRKKKMKEKEMTEAAETTKNLARQIHQLKADVRQLNEKVRCHVHPSVPRVEASAKVGRGETDVNI